MDDDSKETTLFFLQSWLNEAIGRCDDFLNNINKSFSLNSEFIRRRMFEEHYVLTATVMSIRFARQLVNHADKGLKGHLESFIAATKDVVDVRDMREHADEYFIGKGKKPDQFFKGSSRGIQCDMSSSIQNENGYMLGNLIAMEFIRDECKKLLAHLQLKRHHTYLLS